MFPPDELHQEHHGNLVIHLFAIVAYMQQQNRDFLKRLNHFISTYPPFPGLRRLLRDAFYYYTSRVRKALTLATTLKSGDEMEAFMVISVAVFMLMCGFQIVRLSNRPFSELPGEILQPWIHHLEAVSIMLAKTYDTASEAHLQTCTASWMTSVQWLTAQTGEPLNVHTLLGYACH